MIKVLLDTIIELVGKDESGKIKKTPIAITLVTLLVLVGVGYGEYTRYGAIMDITDKIGSLESSQANIIGRLAAVDSLRTSNFEAINSVLSYMSINDRILDEITYVRNVDTIRIMDTLTHINMSLKLLTDKYNEEKLDATKITR